MQSGATEIDGVPLPVEASHPSDDAMALSEMEIIEASGPIRKHPTHPSHPTQATPEPISAGETERISLPLPPDAFPPLRPELARSATGAGSNLAEAVRDAAESGPSVVVRQAGAVPPPLPGHGPVRQERAVELFDLGISLRAAHRYTEALQAWEQAASLAPDNAVYRANVNRLREQLSELGPASAKLPASRLPHLPASPASPAKAPGVATPRRPALTRLAYVLRGSHVRISPGASGRPKLFSGAQVGLEIKTNLRAGKSHVRR